MYVQLSSAPYTGTLEALSIVLQIESFNNFDQMKTVTIIMPRNTANVVIFCRTFFTKCVPLHVMFIK